MSYHCFNCGSEIELTQDKRVGRRDECPSCSSDLHVCLNCKHYDQTAYNQCREPQAERVLDKDRSNFCDYFEFRSGDASKQTQSQSDAKKALDDLFK